PDFIAKKWPMYELAYFLLRRLRFEGGANQEPARLVPSLLMDRVLWFTQRQDPNADAVELITELERFLRKQLRHPQSQPLIGDDMPPI
ncbi:MAG: hypothetical protein AAGA62_17260, partial [Bacteroidota bacterium]